MALLTDKETKKDLSERLIEFGQFGMVFNYMLDEKNIELADLEKIFFDNNRDRATLMYTKLLSRMRPEYLDISYSKYSTLFPNQDCLNKTEYSEYLNRRCLCEIISKLSNEGNIDKTYLNTYSYLLGNSDSREVYAGK